MWLSTDLSNTPQCECDPECDDNIFLGPRYPGNILHTTTVPTVCTHCTVQYCTVVCAVQPRTAAPRRRLSSCWSALCSTAEPPDPPCLGGQPGLSFLFLLYCCLVLYITYRVLSSCVLLHCVPSYDIASSADTALFSQYVVYRYYICMPSTLRKCSPPRALQENRA